MKLGYARVSTIEQNLELQTDALNAAGVERVFTDHASGAISRRPGLDELLSIARAGDVIYVWRLDRLARSLKHLLTLAADLESRGIQLVLLTEQIDTTTPGGRLVFQIFGAIAEFERNLIMERTNAGLEAARSRGKIGGRPTVLTEEKRGTINALVHLAVSNGETPNAGKIGRSVGVSERTVRRFLSRPTKHTKGTKEMGKGQLAGLASAKVE